MGHALLMCGQSKTASDRHFIRGFLDLVVLRAAGFQVSDVVRTIVLTTDLKRPIQYRDYRVPPVPLCAQWLGLLVNQLTDGFHGYRLPIEVIVSWYRARLKDPNAAPQLPTYGRTSDDHGPIRDLSGFDLPTVERAEQIAETRFDLWFRAGHK